jgi:alpha-tubulin suppressor-like RCC1 family protein
VPSTRLRSATARLSSTAAHLILATLAFSGCSEPTEAPSAPEARPALATGSAALSFLQVSAGLDHACGVTTDNRVYCWGYAQWGQLGNGAFGGPEECNTHPCSSRPLAVKGALRFRQVSAGYEHTCAITTEDRAYCWGRNENGQLGDGSQEFRFQPVAVLGATRRFKAIAAGNNFTCGVTRANVALCWGYNAQGQLGIGTTAIRRLSPVRVASEFTWSQLSVGTNHACGVTTFGGGYCWGSNGTGTLGDGTTTDRRAPTPVHAGFLLGQIDPGFSHTCAITPDGHPYCWGTSNSGALGDKSGTRFSPTLVQVGSQRLYTHVSAGDNHTCGVSRAGVGLCWGFGAAGQLGDGTNTNRRTPTPVAGGLLLSQIVAAESFTCAVGRDHRAYCWGNNFYGQLGDGTAENRSSPTAVAGSL